MIRLTVSDDDAGCRFDRFLRARLTRTPLAEIYRLIRTGLARVDEKRCRQSRRLVEGDVISVRVDPAELPSANASDSGVVRALSRTDFYKRNFRVVFEDEALLVCDKPPSLVVHSGSGHTTHDTLVDLARSYLLLSAPSLPGGLPLLVHRLDKDTSGLIILAKNKRALRAIHEHLRAGAIAKQYRLICHGCPPARAGDITADLVRTHDRDSGTKMGTGKDGLPARTSYKVLDATGEFSQVSVRLHTGRTHQVRVHMAHIGCPIVGDIRYGRKEQDNALFVRTRAPRRLYLHAHALNFPHPLNKEPVNVASEPPESFSRLWKALA